jgi:hypothetical protein
MASLHKKISLELLLQWGRAGPLRLSIVFWAGIGGGFTSGLWTCPSLKSFPWLKTNNKDPSIK